MKRNPASRRSAPSLPTFARCPAPIRRSVAITSKRHGTVTLTAGIDLLTGQVHAFVKDRHRSREFIEFLNMLPYPR
jgi:hypothetical protein